MIKNDEALEIVRGSGNLLRDFGYANADLRQARVLLGVQIMHVVDAEGVSTCEAEVRSSVSHSEFSRIRQVKFGRFTLDRLMGILSRPG